MFDSKNVKPGRHFNKYQHARCIHDAEYVAHAHYVLDARLDYLLEEDELQANKAIVMPLRFFLVFLGFGFGLFPRYTRLSPLLEELGNKPHSTYFVSACTVTSLGPPVPHYP